MFLLDMSPLGDQATENIGKSCHNYWKIYEEEEEDEDAAEDNARFKGKRGKMVKRARKRLRKCCKCKSCRRVSKLVKPGE